jgi:hypothetical protein
MKTKPLLITSLILGSSSVAMASPFSFQARATISPSVRIDARAVVRDHRAAPPAASYGWQPARVDLGTRRPADRFDDRFDNRFGDRAGDRFDDRFVALPPVTGPSWDCHNWDPTVDVSSVCTAFESSRPGAMPPVTGAGILLGVRDAAVPDHQYITVEAGQPFRKIVIQGAARAPEISRVAIKFMDGSTEVVNTDARLRQGQSIVIGLDGGGRRQINQLVFYTPSGATGSYAVLGR